MRMEGDIQLSFYPSFVFERASNPPKTARCRVSSIRFATTHRSFPTVAFLPRHLLHRRPQLTELSRRLDLTVIREPAAVVLGRDLTARLVLPLPVKDLSVAHLLIRHSSHNRKTKGKSSVSTTCTYEPFYLQKYVSYKQDIQLTRLLKKSSTTSSKFEKMSASSESGLNIRNLSINAIIGGDPSPLPPFDMSTSSTAAARCIRSPSSSLPAFRDEREGDAAALVGTNAVAVSPATAAVTRMTNIVDEDERIIVQQTIEGSTANAQKKRRWMHVVTCCYVVEYHNQHFERARSSDSFTRSTVVALLAGNISNFPC